MFSVKRKSYRQNRSTFSLMASRIRVYYVKSLALCSEVLKFSNKDERSRFVRINKKGERGDSRAISLSNRAQLSNLVELLGLILMNLLLAVPVVLYLVFLWKAAL